MAIWQSPERQSVRDVEGIIFSLNVGAIDASSTFQYNIEDRQLTWRKYLPFNSVTINNGSGSNITFWINQDSTKAVSIKKGVIKTISGYGISAFTIVTDATAIADTELLMEFERQGMVVDSFTKALASNVFVQAFLGIKRG